MTNEFKKGQRVCYLAPECAITKRRMQRQALFVKDNGDGSATLETTGTLLTQGGRFIHPINEVEAVA